LLYGFVRARATPYSAACMRVGLGWMDGTFGSVSGLVDVGAGTRRRGSST
jgi:hypothetical protein